MISRLLPFLVLLLGASVASAASPTLSGISPRGGQRGTETVLLFGGANLADAQEVLFYAPGFAVTKLEVVAPTQVKVTAKIAPDCRLGEHAMRLRCASGISEMRTFWVGALPNVEEKEPNNDFAAPQKIAMNVTVTGIVQNEDVDYYAVEAKKGQRISAEVEGMRLGNTFFDPYVAILNSKRFELGSNDDSPLLRQDCMVSVVAPEDGTYIIQVRESSYGGNGGAIYRLHVGTFPRPLAMIPSGGRPGEELEVRFIGDPTGEIKQKIKLPTSFDGNFGLFCEDAGGISPSAMPFRLVDLPTTVEVEPNETHAQATVGTAPGAFEGIISTPGDIDHFRFTAKKGQVFDFECYARRHGSALDPIIFIAGLNGGNFASNDDSRGPDSYLRFTVPNDGEYVISVKDHLGKGGPNFFYRLEISTIQPRMDLSFPKVAQYSQERQSIAIPKGNRFATMVSAGRVDFGGELVITAENLPAKVTYATENMAPNMTLVPVVFEAPADAVIGGGLGTISGKHVDPKVTIPSGFGITADYVISNPGQSIYVLQATKPAIAVTEAVPFKISIVEPKVPLVHGGSMNLKIVAERAAGFKAPITIVPLYNPPGVGSATSVVIPEGQNEVLFPLNANGGAPVRKWKYAVMGSAPVGNGPVWASSQLATIEIAPPYVTATIERAAVEQGKQTQMFAKLTVVKPFAGNAKIRLVGLPAKIKFPAELEFNKDTKEVVFPLEVEPTATPGITRNLFVQMVITENGEPIAQNQGSAELRVDVPIPPKPNAPPVPKVTTPTPTPTPNQPPPKRLTRLEQLRLEQEEREKAMKQGTTPPVTPVPPKK